MRWNGRWTVVRTEQNILSRKSLVAVVPDMELVLNWPSVSVWEVVVILASARNSGWYCTSCAGSYITGERRPVSIGLGDRWAQNMLWKGLINGEKNCPYQELNIHFQRVMD
jgi:hypothetical protein